MKETKHEVSTREVFKNSAVTYFSFESWLCKRWVLKMHEKFVFSFIFIQSIFLSPPKIVDDVDKMTYLNQIRKLTINYLVVMATRQHTYISYSCLAHCFYSIMLVFEQGFHVLRKTKQRRYPYKNVLFLYRIICKITRAAMIWSKCKFVTHPFLTISPSPNIVKL